MVPLLDSKHDSTFNLIVFRCRSHIHTKYTSIHQSIHNRILTERKNANDTPYPYHLDTVQSVS